MQLVVISHKETWRSPTSPSGYVTVGGFPFQMSAIAELFDHTRLVTALRAGPPPSGALPLAGKNLVVTPLPEPAGVEWKRKLAMLVWVPRHLPFLWRAVSDADAVHTPVGGDIGTVGIVIALLQRKALFVRHCGTWGRPVSTIDRWLMRLLEKIAGGRNVVLATGGGDRPPSTANPNIHWIFSTPLTRSDLAALPQAQPWQPGRPLRLITVGRLVDDKNIDALLQALPLIQKEQPAVHLDIVGEGERLLQLQQAAASLGLHSAVTFHGNVSHEQVLRLLAGAHLFVFPSRREGFPKAVLEALACGLPALTTPVSVLPYLLRGGAGQLLPDPGPQAIAQAVLALSSRPEGLRGMADNARQTALAYTLEAWRDAIGAELQAGWGRALSGLAESGVYQEPAG
ncbi:MAG: glycosyltransferase family 4 protein [Chloroflexota bacterium]